MPNPVLLAGSLSPEQFKFLKLRSGTSTDAEAMRQYGITKGTLRYWKRNPAFLQVLDAVHTDKLLAFRLLSMSMLELVVDSMLFLLQSPKGSDRRAGVESWRAIMGVDPPKAQEQPQEDVGKTIYNILNIRGDVDPRVLNAANPMKLPVPVVKEVVE